MENLSSRPASAYGQTGQVAFGSRPSLAPRLTGSLLYLYSFPSIIP